MTVSISDGYRFLIDSRSDLGALSTFTVLDKLAEKTYKYRTHYRFYILNFFGHLKQVNY